MCTVANSHQGLHRTILGMFRQRTFCSNPGQNLTPWTSFEANNAHLVKLHLLHYSIQAASDYFAIFWVNKDMKPLRAHSVAAVSDRNQKISKAFWQPQLQLFGPKFGSGNLKNDLSQLQISLYKLGCLDESSIGLKRIHWFTPDPYEKKGRLTCKQRLWRFCVYCTIPGRQR